MDLKEIGYDVRDWINLATDGGLMCGRQLTCEFLYKIRENTGILFEASKANGLEVNPEKTKYMIMSRDQNIVRNGNIKIGDLSFEEVEKFKYLGATRREIRTHDQRPAREHIARASRGKGKGAYTRGRLRAQLLLTAVNVERPSRLFQKSVEVEENFRGYVAVVINYGREGTTAVLEFSVIQSVSKPEQASLVYRSSTRVCVRNCISIRRPEFECSGPQLEGPEFECSGPQLEGPEFEYSELSLKVCGSRYCEILDLSSSNSSSSTSSSSSSGGGGGGGSSSSSSSSSSSFISTGRVKAKESSSTQPVSEQ
ncbi:hypothetical protein ANN_10051 [Periplaneta americana]|uniref:Uncharacterized protein n=1 Tax=Periplaneta americana TaxID=6978 RepID=A0ABQ8TR22_PERAM|nr:hypothetical protein ANN_10051 [Periplaneta americana]